MKPRRLPMWLFVLGALACGSSERKVAQPTEPEIAVENAALPFSIVRGRGGQELSYDELVVELRQTKAVCIGESHSNPHHHWSQLHVLRSLLAEQPANYALGMEMFQTPFQGVLDDYRAGTIDEGTFLERSLWKKRWGFDYRLYRPMIDAAVTSGASLLALNTPRELTKKVAKVGVAGLTETEAAGLPEMNLQDENHRVWFEAIMSGHPGSHGAKEEKQGADVSQQTERIYQAQVLWDETMAQTAASWLGAASDRRIVILAGNGHCHDSAIVGRLRRRGIDTVVSVRPVIDDGDGNVGELLAQPQNDYLFVMN